MKRLGLSDNDIVALDQCTEGWIIGLPLAVKYRLLAQDFERAAVLIDSILDQLIARWLVKTLMQWIDTLPEYDHISPIPANAPGMGNFSFKHSNIGFTDI